MKMRVVFTLAEHADGTKRICLSRDELLAMENSLDQEDTENHRLIEFLRHLGKELSK